MTSLLVIASGAFLPSELLGEFGRLPSSFIPAQNRRLFELQIEEAGASFDHVAISLPADFVLEGHDIVWMERHSVIRIPVEARLALGESILTVLSDPSIKALNISSLAILHGDTLFKEADFSLQDAFSVGESRPEYEWAHVKLERNRIIDVREATGEAGPVLSGYFHFAQPRVFEDLLQDSPSFVAALASYVKDRNVSAVFPNSWLDFGHIHTYFDARRVLTTERSFNSLTIAGRAVVKSSTKTNRIAAESSWFETLPHDLRVFTPQYLGRTNDSYSIEYLHLASLSDLFVYGSLSNHIWNDILEACSQLLHRMNQIGPPAGDEDAFDYEKKTLRRLTEHSALGGVVDQEIEVNGHSYPSLQEMTLALSRIVAERTPKPTLVHGDLCFSNILYDFRTRSIKVVDPRGENMAGDVSCFGDPRYDLAKLCHSAIGGYDLIISGRYEMEQQEPTRLRFQAGFSGRQESVGLQFLERIRTFGYSEPELFGLTALLFISMLPLHVDRPLRQAAFIATACDFYRRTMEGLT